MIIAGREDAQVVRCSDSSGIGWLRVSSSQGVSCDGSFANIIATFSTDNESFVSNTCVEGRDRTLEEIGEEASVDVWLLVVQVEFAAVCRLGREVVGEDFGLQTLGHIVLELDFGVELIGRGPRLGQGEA